MCFESLKNQAGGFLKIRRPDCIKENHCFISGFAARADLVFADVVVERKKQNKYPGIL